MIFGNQIITNLKCAINIFNPTRCIVCGDELRFFEKAFCTKCLSELPLTYFWNYPDNYGKELFPINLHIKSVISLLFYKGEVKEAIHKFKYNHNLNIGKVLGEYLGIQLSQMAIIQSFIEDGFIIIPIPIHWLKKRKRGYNQSEIIAHYIKRGMRNSYPKVQIEIENHLIKRKNFTPTQTKLHKLERFRNIQNAFSLNIRRFQKMLKGLRKVNIFIVDDVLTTGATITACAQLISDQYNIYYAKEPSPPQLNIYVATLAIGI